MTNVDALVARVTATGVQRVYKLNKVPASPTYPYAVVGLGSPDKVSRTADGQATDVERCTVQFFGRDVDGVLDIASKADLDGDFIDGRLCTREIGTDPYRDPDDRGVLAILHTYRF